MENIETILTCSICMEIYNDSDRKPLFLLCGHTFCGKCLRFVYHKPTLNCPLDKKTHKFDAFDKIPINFSVLNLISSSPSNKDNQAIKSEKKCEKHPKESLKFYCKTHDIILCQNCMLEDHMGTGHEISSAEKMIQSELLKQDTQKCMEKINRHIGQLTKYHDDLIEQFNSQKKSLVNCTKILVEEINSQLQECLNNFDATLSSERMTIEQELKVLKEYETSIEEVNEKIQTNNCSEEAVKEAKVLVNKISHYAYDIDNDQMEIDDCIYISSDLAKHIYVDQKSTVDPTLRSLLQQFKDRSMITQQVFDLMSKIDRKHFVPEEMAHQAYSDIPRSIGWGTTISAPHMHAITLERLKEKMIPGGKAIDIGTGSGYIAAAMAETMGKGCTVYMVDHIKEIIDFALKNIKKGNQYLIKQKRIIPMVQDGRKGLPDQGPYDLIHVGGAVDELSSELINQLKPGGRMWVPIGSSYAQSICLIDKDMDGNVTTDKIMDVRYGSLTSVENQLSEPF